LDSPRCAKYTTYALPRAKGKTFSIAFAIENAWSIIIVFRCALSIASKNISNNQTKLSIF